MPPLPLVADAIPGTSADAVPGLVWAYLFAHDEPGRPIDGQRLADALESDEGFVWLHLNRADRRCHDWIRDAAPMPEEAREHLLDTEDNIMLEALEGTLVGTFPDFRREFDHGTQDIARLHFALGDRLLLTCRRQALHAAEVVHRQVAAGEAFPDAPAILEAIIEVFVKEVMAVTRELGRSLETIEDRVVDDTLDETPRLGPIRRVALKLSRQVGSLKIHSAAFVRGDERAVSDEIFAMVERMSLQLEGAGREIDSIQERARILQEEVSAKLAGQANSQLYALSVMTALFLPATLVTGLFGMNTHGLPFDAAEGGFWYALTLCALGSAAVYVLLRWLGVTK